MTHWMFHKPPIFIQYSYCDVSTFCCCVWLKVASTGVSTMKTVEEETGRSSSSWRSIVSRSLTAGRRLPADSRVLWISAAGSQRLWPVALPLYGFGQAMLGFTNNHRLGFTKVSDGQESKVSLTYSVLNHVRCLGTLKKQCAIELKLKNAFI